MLFELVVILWITDIFTLGVVYGVLLMKCIDEINEVH